MNDPRSQVPRPEILDYLKAACDFAELMSRRINEVMASGFDIQAKADQSVVTTADTEAETAFREAVVAKYPQHGILGEEFPAINQDADFIWVVDPIDGTAEFAHGMPVWGIIIALYYKGEPIVGLVEHPALQLRCVAGFGLGTEMNGRRVQVEPISDLQMNGRERVGTPSRYNYSRPVDDAVLFDRLSKAHPNLRIFHTCYTHLLAASGGLDAAIEWNSPLWDVAASRILIEEAGGKYLCLGRYKNEAGVECFNVVFGRPELVDRIGVVLQK